MIKVVVDHDNGSNEFRRFSIYKVIDSTYDAYLIQGLQNPNVAYVIHNSNFYPLDKLHLKRGCARFVWYDNLTDKQKFCLEITGKYDYE